MWQFELNLIQNDEYDKVINTWAENSSDINVSGHIETIIEKLVSTIPVGLKCETRNSC